ncbi:MAG: hypothetical protein RL368_1366 [Pseudomonadota bacterium]
MMQGVPYWRLSALYFFYFATLGALQPYWSLYLHSLHFDAQAIGELSAILMATKIVAPNLGGWLADHTQRHMIWVQLSAILTVLCFAGVFFGETYAWLALTITAFSFFWNMVVPQLEATAFAYLGKAGSHRYSHIRLWGSVGFVVTVICLGALLEYQPISVLPIAMLGIFALVAISSLLVRECHGGYAEHHNTSDQPLSCVLRKPVVLAFFFACILLQASHGSYYTFYSLYLKSHNYSSQSMGQLWALAVLAEVVAFMGMHRLLLHFSLRHLLMASFSLGTLRWLLIANFIDNLGVVIFAQVLHAASFALYHGVAIQFVYRYFPGRLQGRGQALYSSLTFGLGGAIGNLLSGYTWDSLGATWTYTLSSGMCAAALLIVIFGLREQPEKS